MDNITAVIDRKVWNIIEDASEQACAEYGVNEKEVWSDGKRFVYTLSNTSARNKAPCAFYVEFRLAIEELQEAA